MVSSEDEARDSRQVDVSEGAEVPSAASFAGASFAAKVTNFVIFQTVYAACVLGSARGHVWLGPLAGALLLPINLWFFPAHERSREVRLWIIAGAIGLVLDSGLQGLNAIAFPDITRIAPESVFSAWLVPPWIVTLWVAVGTMLRTSLGWLRGRYVLAATFGAIGGPFSFWSGARLGATELPLGWTSFALLGFEYAVVMPLLLRLSDLPRSRPGAATSA